MAKNYHTFTATESPEKAKINQKEPNKNQTINRNLPI